MNERGTYVIKHDNINVCKVPVHTLRLLPDKILKSSIVKRKWMLGRMMTILCGTCACISWDKRIHVYVYNLVVVVLGSYKRGWIF